LNDAATVAFSDKQSCPVAFEKKSVSKGGGSEGSNLQKSKPPSAEGSQKRDKAPVPKKKSLSMTSRLRGAVKDNQSTSPAQRIKSDRGSRTWQHDDLKKAAAKLNEEDEMGSTAFAMDELDSIEAMLAAADAQMHGLEKEEKVMRRKGTKFKENSTAPARMKERRPKEKRPDGDELETGLAPSMERSKTSMGGRLSALGGRQGHSNGKEPSSRLGRSRSVLESREDPTSSASLRRSITTVDAPSNMKKVTAPQLLSPLRVGASVGRGSPTAFQKLAAMGSELSSRGLQAPGPEDVGIGEAYARWWGAAGPLKGVLICIAANGSGGYCGPCSDMDVALHLRKGLYDHLASKLPITDGVAVLQLGCSLRGPHFIGESIEEVRAAIEWCRKNASGKGISLVGHGVGGVVALHAAIQCKKHVKGVAILSCTPDGLPKPQELKQLRGEVFFGIGTNDEVTNGTVQQTMFVACPKPKQQKLYNQGSHELVEVKSELIQDTMEWIGRMY